ncbi:MAG: hypothetical protein FWD66_01130 [Paludibacter sp.]|nr:hypothetical protein [Paludibacter sp.]
MNRQFNNKNTPLELNIVPAAEWGEQTLFRELGEDKRPNENGVVPHLAVDYNNDGCMPSFRIYQSFDGEGNGGGGSTNTSTIPLPRCRVFTRDTGVYDEQLGEYNVYEKCLYMDLYPPKDIDLFNSFYPRICFFNYKCITGDIKWRPMMKNVGEQERGILAEVSTLPVTWGRDQMLFESYEDFQIILGRFMPILNMSTHLFSNPRSNRTLNSNKAIRFSLGLVYNPARKPVKEYKQGTGLHYIRLANFNIVSTNEINEHTNNFIVAFGKTIT